VTQR